MDRIILFAEIFLLVSDERRVFTLLFIIIIIV